MLITFSSETFENIIMFEDVAKKLLMLMGNSGTVPGAILAEDVPQALSNLENGLKQTQSSEPSSSKRSDDNHVSLAHRAIPLMNMLKSAMTHHSDILWK